MPSVIRPTPRSRSPCNVALFGGPRCITDLPPSALNRSGRSVMAALASITSKAEASSGYVQVAAREESPRLGA